MSIVKKFGYKNYIGTYESRFYRIWQICYFNLRERIWNQKSVLITYAILLFISLIIIIPVTAALSSNYIKVYLKSLPPNEIRSLFETFYGMINYVLITNPLTFILFGFIGGKIISEDIEYKSMEQYFLRIKRSDYLIGKFLALFLSYFLSVLSISFIFYYFLCSTLNYSLLDLVPLGIFISIIAFLFIISLTCSLLMLALSGATEKKNYATLIFILIFLVTGDVFKIFSVFLDSNIYLLFNPQEIIFVILKSFISLNPLTTFLVDNVGINIFNPLTTTIKLSDALGMIILTCLVSTLFVYKKINTIWN